MDRALFAPDFAEHLCRTFPAATATRPDAQSGSELVYRSSAFADAFPNLAFRNCVADAEVHRWIDRLIRNENDYRSIESRRQVENGFFVSWLGSAIPLKRLHNESRVPGPG